MKIFSYSLGELATNCYIVAENKNCIVIDPADSPEFIAEEIQRRGLNPLAIIATHGHFDHILGVTGLKLIFGIPFWMHKKDEFLANNMQYSGQKWLNRRIDEPNPKIDPVRNSAKPLLSKTHKAKPPNGLRCFGNKVQLLISNGAGKFLKDKSQIKIGDEILEVIETSGHTPGSICLHNKKNKIIFTGDLLFKNGVGRTDFSYGDEKLLKKSLKKIFKLPDDTIIYPGHGLTTSIKDEK